MKILFFNYEYPPLGGGAANATAQILGEYSKIPGLEVDLITSSIDSEYHLEEIGNNVKIHRLPIGKNESNLHFQSQKDLLVYAWQALKFSKKLCREKKFDLTHSFFTVPCGFVSCRLKKKFGLPFIVSLRGSDVPGYSDRFPLLYVFLKPIIKKIWKNAAAVVSNSLGLKELALKTNTKQEISVIYNGVDTEKFKPAKPPREFIITPGASRLTDRKGLNYLVEAVKILSSKYPQVKLKIMGEGNAGAALEEQVKKSNLSHQVEFLGRIPREKTFSYYQEADVFVLPSLNEGMSNAMLEALSSGLPIVSTPTGGASELVKDGQNGFIVEYKNAKDIAEKLEKLINDKELRCRMGERSREKALKLSWKNVAENYYNLYRKIRN